MFLLSLLNPLKQIPEHARFRVKMKMMEVIEAEMKICRPTLAPQMNPQYQFQQNRSTNSEQLQLKTLPYCSSNFIATNTQHPVVQRLPSTDQRFDIDSPSTYSSNSVMSPCSDRTFLKGTSSHLYYLCITYILCILYVIKRI
jgi:hypothetical protein